VFEMKGERRSLLKGAMAAPFVLTVGPAAAQANASSIMCLKRDAARAAEQNTPVFSVVDGDDWMRVSCELFRLRVGEGAAAAEIPGKYFLGLDRFTYWRLDEGAGRLTATRTTYTTGTPNCIATRLGERRFALVYVDQTGQRVGYAAETKGGTPVTGSCWTSVAVLRR
jgi:hypothetical protein